MITHAYSTQYEEVSGQKAGTASTGYSRADFELVHDNPSMAHLNQRHKSLTNKGKGH